MGPLHPILMAVVVCTLSGLPLHAQDAGTDGQGTGGQAAEGQGPEVAAPLQAKLPPPVLTLDQDRLFKESAYGRAVLARAESDGKALAAENRRIEDALEKEERDLTDRRTTMNAADFATIASEFDVKVKAIRDAQDGKSRAITRRLEEDRQHFFESATPILGDLLAESGAAAILADSAIIMSLTSLDITSAAIARMDAAVPAPASAPEPSTEPTPAPDPAPQANP